MKADYENMFLMIRNPDARWVWVDPEDPRWGQPGFDRWGRRLLRGEAEADPPLRLVYPWRGKPGDVTWDTFLVFIVISERVVELLQRQGFTGWKTYPVEIRSLKGRRLAGYAGLGVTGRVGRRDDSRSRRVDKALPSGAPYEIQAFFFQDDFWDGSDFCCPEVGTEVIVTRRVAEAFQEAGIGRILTDGDGERGKNGDVRFLPLPEYRIHPMIKRGVFADGSPLRD